MLISYREWAFKRACFSFSCQVCLCHGYVEVGTEILFRELCRKVLWKSFLKVNITLFCWQRIHSDGKKGSLVSLLSLWKSHNGSNASITQKKKKKKLSWLRLVTVQKLCNQRVAQYQRWKVMSLWSSFMWVKIWQKTQLLLPVFCPFSTKACFFSDETKHFLTSFYSYYFKPHFILLFMHLLFNLFPTLFSFKKYTFIPFYCVVFPALSSAQL